jgi:DNA polymerase III subunit epsilon
MRPIFYDTETTGVQAKRDRIIELAAYDPEREATFERLIHPGCPIPPSASAIHGITDEMVADSDPFDVVAVEFAAFCDGEVVLVAHNNDGFDRHFIREEYARCNVELPEWHYFDTLKWARRYRPDLPKHSLQFLRETYGFEENNAHRALDDVKILYQIYLAMVDDLPIKTALELINRKGGLTHMPFGKHRGKPFKELPKDYVQWLKGSGALEKPGNEELKEAFEAL